MGRRTRGPRLALAAAVALAAAATASAVPAASAPAPAQPAGSYAENFEVLGQVSLGGKAADGDVWFHDHGGDVGPHAYVGTWRTPCTGRGVKIVDVGNPTRGAVVGVAHLARDDVSYEDVVVARAGGRPVLATGVQACRGGRGGLALFDVSDPRRPRKLAFVKTLGHGVHELDVVRQADGRVLALATVPFVEGHASQGDLHIFDITRPRAPTLITTWGLIAGTDMELVRRQRPVTSVLSGLGYYAAHFGHGVRGADAGRTAYVSYWDGGVVKLDIGDPSQPRVVGRTGFTIADDGDAHSMTLYEAGGERYILQNDEDLDVRSISTITSTTTGQRRFHAIDLGLRSSLGRVGGKTAALIDAGDGCEASDFAAAAGQIAMFDLMWGRPDRCTLDVKMTNAVDAFAAAVIVNLVADIDPQAYVRPTSTAVQYAADRGSGMPGVVIAEKDGFADRVRAAAAAGEAVTVTLTPEHPSWGYLRIFKESITSDPEGDSIPNFGQVGIFHDVPNVMGDENSPPGTWSGHNTEVLGNRAYSSWYSNGVVAIDLTDPALPRRVGWFVPPYTTRRGRAAREFDRGDFPLTWGVAVDPATGIVYASDMRTGLWILRPTGEAAPSF